ncbi:MAG: rubrerythrin family protein [Desulfobacterales bacterium]|nr:rubrerythrin family protein [Desulfobacterales bacterium]
MPTLNGSETEKHLLAAFAGESQARSRYTVAAKIAKKEGYEQISGIFMETAENELEHAKMFFKQLQGGEATITAGYPAGVVGDTLAQLKAAAEGEKLEWTTLYTNSSDVAKQEGFDKIADVFNHIAEVEQWHERRYNKLIEAVTSGTVFKALSPALWKCRNCGRVHEGTEPPDICPSCLHPKAHFELYVENY